MASFSSPELPPLPLLLHVPSISYRPQSSRTSSLPDLNSPGGIPTPSHKLSRHPHADNPPVTSKTPGASSGLPLTHRTSLPDACGVRLISILAHRTALCLLWELSVEALRGFTCLCPLKQKPTPAAAAPQRTRAAHSQPGQPALPGRLSLLHASRPRLFSNPDLHQAPAGSLPVPPCWAVPGVPHPGWRAGWHRVPPQFTVSQSSHTVRATCSANKVAWTWLQSSWVTWIIPLLPSVASLPQL